MKKKPSAAATIFLILMMILLVMPFYVMIVGSFKPNIALSTIPIDLSPFRNLIIKNYTYVLEKSQVLLWMKNSFTLSLAVGAITCLVSATAGYAFSKIKFPGRELIFMMVMATMMLPKQMLLIPNYLVAYKLHLQNSWTGVVLTTVAPAFGVFLCRQFMSTIPDELTEAAEIDGCSEVRKFVRIIVPMALPAVGTVFIFSFFSCFNDYIWQLIMISNKKLMTLPIGLSTFAQKATSTNKSYQMAISCISTLPLIALFLACQRFFIKGITTGAVKG